MKLKALIVISAATVGVAAPAFAQIPVPTVQAPVPVPTVKAPVPVPTVQVPVPVPTVKAPVPVPTVQVPVPVPTVKAPVPVPTVQVPKVPVPDVPGVTSPSGGGSGGGGSSGGSRGGSGEGSKGGSSSGGSSGGGSSSGASDGGGSSSGASDGGGSSSSGGSSSGGSSGSSAQGGSSAGGGSSTGGKSRASTPRASTPSSSSRAGGSPSRTTTKSPAVRCRAQSKGANRRECVLRETVTQSSRCLDDLSAAQRRVLTLRAGVGPATPRSRSGVAKRLKISERRVVRLERTGLSRLRTLSKSGGCAAPSQSQSQAQPQATTSADGAVAPIAATTLRATSSSAGKDSGGSGRRKGGGGGSGGGSDADGTRGGIDKPKDSPSRGGIAGLTFTNPGGPSPFIALAVFLLVLAALGVALVRRYRPSSEGPTFGPVAAASRPAEPPEPKPRSVWIPWRRSTMDGPGWTSAPPPSGEDSGEWAAAPESEHDDDWLPPSPRRKVH